MNPQSNTTPLKRAWPDMSAYGIHFGVLEMPNGESRMVMVDSDGAWSALAQRMGFSQSRWFGLYVKASLKLDIPGFKTNFPSAKVLQLTDREIRQRIKPLVLERRNQRISQMNPGSGRLSWHPSRTEVAAAAALAAQPPQDNADTPAELEPMTAEAALRQTLFLGTNYLGQEVYESGDGHRFARSAGNIVANEASDSIPSPTFLRAANEDDLALVAAGMVLEIDGGKHLHSDDFIRFLEAVHGVGASEDKDSVGRFHAALDRSMLERVKAVEGSGQDAFSVALRLHEGRPSFWRAAGSWSTPLPISVVMQSLATARIQQLNAGADPVVVDITAPPRAHSWSLHATSVTGGEIPTHDIALAGVFGRPTRIDSLSGIRVTRTDTEAFLSSLEKRTSDGLTVFVMTAESAGRLDNEFRRALSTTAQKYEITGLVDLDPSLVGPGGTTCSRLIVVGKKRAVPDYAFAVPAQIPVLYDYTSLWNWGETLRAAELGEIQTFGDDGREENRWQAPYIPASQISEPKAMSPRNLLGPVRKALARVVEKSGLGIDEFVCAKLNWTMSQLEERLDAEQADAVAIGIQAIDDDKGMVEADATGMGKGRVTAALALYSKSIGKPVVFLTEKADLFTDFYRDVMDIGAMAELGNPFIVNSDLVIQDPDLGGEIARSPSRELAQMIFACGEPPNGYDLVMATYSQFNRQYQAEKALASTAIARGVRSLISENVDPFEVLSKLGGHVGLSDYSSLGLTDQTGAIAMEQALLASARANGQADLVSELEERVRLLQMDRDELTESLSGRIKSDMTTLKHQWLYSGALDGSMIITDESHIAAGAESNTGTNMRHLVDRSTGAIYSSATYAKDVKNFLLYSRLFPASVRVSNIGETLERGGEAMQEIISAMLAEDGRLVRREHDLSSLEFKLAGAGRYLQRNEAWSDAYAQVLAAMSLLSGEIRDTVGSKNNELEKALSPLKVKGVLPATIKRTGVQYTNFSSKFYNLTRAFMLAVNADVAADLAIEALREGRKPVIVVENTMESVLRELVYGIELDAGHEQPGQQIPIVATTQSPAAGDPLAAMEAAANNSEGAPPTDAAHSTSASRKPQQEIHLGRAVSFKDILHAYVESMFVAVTQERKGNKILSRESLNLKEPKHEPVVAAIRALIDSMPEVPLSPLDMVRDRITAAGYSVDEISGRRLALRRNADGSHSVVRMPERRKQSLKRAFNNGSLDALLLTKSGSTGISLHASRTFADQSQREVIELQVASDIAQRLQFWGRVNRKNQVCSPIVHMIGSGLPAEMRLITMQNASLRRMSANISGNADNSALNDEAPDILNRIGNEVAYRWMEANPVQAKIIGFDVSEQDELVSSGRKWVDMLTGRLMMLDVATQRRVYQEITAEFKAVIEQYELSGFNPLKSAEHDLRAKPTANAVVQVATGAGSVFDGAVVASELTYPVSLPALDRVEVEAACEAGRQALANLYGTTYAEVIGQDSISASNAMLPAMLAKRHATVEAALAEERPNAVKGAVNKFSWLSEKLLKVRPGSILCYADQVVDSSATLDRSSAWDAQILVTGWKVPTANKLSMAEYKIQGYSRSTRKRVEISLSSLYRGQSWTICAFGRDPMESVIADHDEFFSETTEPAHGFRTRIVLGGNLYRAAEIAESQKQGTTITYSDERGVWHHAILLPQTYTMRRVMDMPVTIDSSATMLAAFFRPPQSDEVVTTVVMDDLRDNGKKASFRLVGGPSGISLHVFSSEKTAWLINSATLKPLFMNGSYNGSRIHREGRVLAGREAEFLTAFMGVANQAGVPLLMGGDMRPWYNDYLAAKAVPKTSQQTIDAALSSSEDADLDSLLALAP